MARTTLRPKRKPTSGRYKDYRKKKLRELAREPTMTKLSEAKAKKIRLMGGNSKLILLSSNTANIYNPKTKKYQKAKIKTIVESPSNRHFVRRNIMTKGTIIDTDLGKAKITNRPGQEGTINAILV